MQSDLDLDLMVREGRRCFRAGSLPQSLAAPIPPRCRSYRVTSNPNQAAGVLD